MKPWYWVLSGGIFEAVWALCMKLTDGFRDPFWDIMTGIFIVVSVYFLNRGLKAGLPMGPCYAVWVGIGAICSTIGGILVFGETLGPMSWICLGVVVAGIIGINYVSESDRPRARIPLFRSLIFDAVGTLNDS